MGVPQPALINTQFAAGFNARDVDALLALYADDGAVVERDGSVSVGLDAIRRHLDELVAIGGTMTSTNLSSVEVGDIALITAEWTIIGSVAGNEISGRSAEVLRRCADGTWVYVIDQPT